MVSRQKEPSPYRRFYTKDADLHQWVKQTRSQTVVQPRPPQQEVQQKKPQRKTDKNE